MKQNETATSGALAEIGPFAKHESATRDHVRTLAERIETGLASAVEALESAGATRMPSSATYGVALAHVSAEVWANPAWTRAKSGESGSEERADEARESADFAASQVLMNVVPAHQAPYRAEVIIRSAGAIVHAEVLMVIGIAGCESESGFTVACLSADSDTVEDLGGQGAQPPGPGGTSQRHRRVDEPGDRRTEHRHGNHGRSPRRADPVAWAKRWGRIMLRHARDGT